MTDVMGLPATAGLPKNLSELSVFNGMPSEHANRVVSAYHCYLLHFANCFSLLDALHLFPVSWHLLYRLTPLSRPSTCPPSLSRCPSPPAP